MELGRPVRWRVLVRNSKASSLWEIRRQPVNGYTAKLYKKGAHLAIRSEEKKTYLTEP